MSFMGSLVKGFVRSAVNQVGRDGGKVISNAVYNGAHSTPVRGTFATDEAIGDSDQNFDASIQPPIVAGNPILVFLKGAFIQVIPFGLVALIYRAITLLTRQRVAIYEERPVTKSDRRFKRGYRIEGYTLAKTGKKRSLSPLEIKHSRRRGIYYFISMLLSVVAYYKVLMMDETKVVSGNASVEKSIVSSTKGLHLREQSSSHSKTLLTIPHSDTVVVVSRIGGAIEKIGGKEAPWVKVKYNNKEGWAWSGGLVDVTELKSPKPGG